MSGGAVFAATDSGLAAVDAAAGTLRWFDRVPGLTGSKRVLVRSSRVLSTASMAVRAHDVTTGALLWERPFDPDREYPAGADPAADDATMYVGLHDGRVAALAQSDGHTVWEAHIATSDWLRGRVRGSTIAGDTLFVTATRDLNENAFLQSAVVVALDRLTGRELWRFQTPNTDIDTDHSPALTRDNVIFLDGASGYIVAVSRTTHAQVWVKLFTGFFFNGPVIRGDTIFAVTSASRAYAVNAATGATFWTATLKVGATSDALCGDVLFVGDFHVELRSASTGAFLGLAFTGTPEEIVTSDFVAADGMAYVGTNKRLMAFRCE